MSAKPTTETGPLVCECCAVLIANADTSGCEHNCGDDHHERLADFGEGVLAVLTEHDGPQFNGVFRCAGCGDDSYGYAGRIDFCP